MGDQELRAAMVARLVSLGRIVGPEVEAAFRAVPRHLFLPELEPSEAYRDHAVTTKWQDGEAVSSASQPSMMAIMLEQLALQPGHRVLEIGAGTGYNAALMAHIVGPTGSVVAVDIDDDIVAGAGENLAAAGVSGVTLATGDGALGYPSMAPYDRIVATVGSWDIQPAWWSELADGGRLLLPLSVGGSQLSTAFDLEAGPPPTMRASSVRCCAFVRLRGHGAVAEGAQPLGPDGVAVAPVDPGSAGAEPFTPADVSRVLLERGSRTMSAVGLCSMDLWDGFGLWSSIAQPGMCRLLVDPGASRRWPSLLPSGMDGGTMMLVDLSPHRTGIAVVVPSADVPDQADDLFPIAVHGYGPDHDAVAGRLLELLEEWVALGRPTAGELAVTATRPEGPRSDDPGIELTKQHCRLALAYPGMTGAPLLDRPIVDG
ncbi:MAG TPA: methyltransferase domain-containing protein [Pseudonocardia sp.]|nr:methyltransferase domain-containing protein [Pseudonocardia sp.]